MTNTIFFKGLAVAFMALFIVSCDKDYNTIGSDVVGNEHFNFLSADDFFVKAYDQKIDPIQTNNLPLNFIGISNNSVFGKTTSNFVTQMQMVEPNPTFDASAVIDSVVVTVPYFSHSIGTDSEGHTKYELDSIYGDGELDLKVYENRYYLRDFDPATNFTTSQKYYSDQNPIFDSNKQGLSVSDPDLGDRLNNWVDPDVADNVLNKRQNLHFKPEPAVYKKRKVTDQVMTEEVEARYSPRIRLRLDNSYFTAKIINAADGKLKDNNTFKEYFRGLYFQVGNAASGPNIGLDFTKGDVTIFYKQNKSGSTTDKEMKEFKFTLTGTTVNLHNNDFSSSPSYVNALANTNNVEGDDKLYVNGREGSAALVEILNASDKTFLKGKLINQAYLYFTIDQSSMTGLTEPNRVYLFNAEKNRPLYDYFFDSSTDNSDAKKNKVLHGGIIEKETVGLEKRGVRYKINITEHINNIVNKDSTNWKLGLVVTESINYSGSAYLKTPTVTPKMDRYPVSTVMNPLGTILFGTNSSVPNDKKVKLKVFYTNYK